MLLAYLEVQSLSIVEHLGPELIKLSKTVTEVDALTGNFLNTHGFPQCLVWKINTH